MGIEKLTTGIISNISYNIAEKKGAYTLGQALKDVTQTSSKKLTNALDCLAAAKEAAICAKYSSKNPMMLTKKAVDIKPAESFTDVLVKKVVSPMPTAKSFAREAVSNGSNAQEAVNGAKAAMAAISKPVGFSAKESAKTFIEAGESQLEKKLNLQEKYGSKLKEVKAKQAKELANKAKIDRYYDEMAKVTQILSE